MGPGKDNHTQVSWWGQWRRALGYYLFDRQVMWVMNDRITEGRADKAVSMDGQEDALEGDRGSKTGSVVTSEGQAEDWSKSMSGEEEGACCSRSALSCCSRPPPQLRCLRPFKRLALPPPHLRSSRFQRNGLLGCQGIVMRKRAGSEVEEEMAPAKRRALSLSAETSAPDIHLAPRSAPYSSMGLTNKGSRNRIPPGKKCLYNNKRVITIKRNSSNVTRWRQSEGEGAAVKWKFLEHHGPAFPPPYEPLPAHVHFLYDGRPMRLNLLAEEGATLYARFLGHRYTTNPLFNENFFNDWRTLMTPREANVITDLSRCDFREIHAHLQTQKESRARKEARLRSKAIENQYGYCLIDGRVEKIGNFRIEPPGLFRGRGDHPKMGKIKRRVMPEDVIVNCSPNSRIPSPPPGRRWKEVRHDNTVTWLDSWKDGVLGVTKYVTLDSSSALNSAQDRRKFNKARKLRDHIELIRETYRRDWSSQDPTVRQRAVALYLIDRLALRAGADRDGDTVGCCTLRVQHVTLHRRLHGQPYVVELDFPGKDSVRYHKEVSVEQAVYENLAEFVRRKGPYDYIFDRLTAQTVNEHLKQLMPGLTAKVFRTYNASMTLQTQLDELTVPTASVRQKLVTYRRANRAVACLCNHFRATTEGQEKALINIRQLVAKKQKEINDVHGSLRSICEESTSQKMRRALRRLSMQLKTLKFKERELMENKNISLNTSKLNYIDPRITVAWCKKYNVPIKRVFSKKQRDKFHWAITTTRPNFRF